MIFYEKNLSLESNWINIVAVNVQLRLYQKPKNVPMLHKMTFKIAR